MKIYKYPEDYAERKIRLEEARLELKSKFKGIDEQIDLLINHITLWYVHPEKITRPLKVNLWGPTGVGKTDLCRDLSRLLGMGDSYMEQLISSNEGERTLLEDVQENCLHLTHGVPGILVLDEFQHFRSKKEDGLNKSGMGYKDVWQILSDGVIVQSIDKEEILSFCSDLGYDIFNGFQISRYSNYSNSRVSRIFNMGLDAEDEDDEDDVGTLTEEGSLPLEVDLGTFDLSSVYTDVLNKKSESDKLKLLKTKLCLEPWRINIIKKHLPYRDVNNIAYMGSYPRNNIEKLTSLSSDFKKISLFVRNRGYTNDGSVEGLMESLDSLLAESTEDSINYENDFRKNLILILGNLDDVYEYKVPSSSSYVPADIFREWSKEINIFDVKESLSQLFYPEQVARLGNIHIIYPLLGNKDFKEIIKIKMDERIFGEIGEFFAIKDVHQTVYDFVYRNGVYPLQGVRPVLSTVDSTCNEILRALHYWNVNQQVSIRYDLDNFSLVLKTKDDSYGFSLIGDRDLISHRIIQDKVQTYEKAVHEAGHIIALHHTQGVSPELSILGEKGAWTLASGKDLGNFKSMWDEVVVLLSGYAANYKILGPERCSGFQKDLSQACQILVDLVRVHGWRNELRVKVQGKLRRIYNLIFNNPKMLNAPYPSETYSFIKKTPHVLDVPPDAPLVEKALKVATKEAFKMFSSKEVEKATVALADHLAERLYIDEHKISSILKNNMKITRRK